MFTDFIFTDGTSVSATFSWVQGVPYSTVAAQYTGYAPYFSVDFANQSSNDTLLDPSIIESYEWDFGDYYNNATNNITLSTTSSVSHVFVMPGQYTVTLNHTRSQYDVLVDPKPAYCLGAYNHQWYWDNLVNSAVEAATWDQLACAGSIPKLWNDSTECVQKYCSSWKWHELQYIGSNPFIWSQTKSNNAYPKKWAYEANDTECESINVVTTVLNAIQQSVIKTALITVLEIPLSASLVNLSPITSGGSPLSAQFTPRFTQTGSFPIDKIDWNLGNDIKYTVTRFGVPDPLLFTFTGSITSDLADPRNYDAITTYSQGTFTPAITAYAMSTGATSVATTAIGPIPITEFNTNNNNIKIVKVRSTENGSLYALDINNTLVFATT
jgi:hypothetical protein